jgi:hypothetical protein
VALTTYINDLRDILHDPTAQFWSDQSLTNYINKGRNRVCQDTKCLRQPIVGFALTTGQEQYLISSLPVAYRSRIIDVMSIDLYWGQTRNPLMYMPFTQFSAQLRYWQNYLQRPVAYSRMGALSIYFGPVPDQAYLTDWIVAINPNPLVDDTTVEEIPVPFTEPVIFWAAYEAKFKEQAIGEAKLFKDEYKSRVLMIASAFFTRMIPDPLIAGR